MRPRVLAVTALLLGLDAVPAVAASPHWRAPVRADGASEVAAGVGGDVAVVTLQTAPTAGQTVGIRSLRPDGRLSVTRAIETGPPLSRVPLAAVDGKGNAVVAWQTATAGPIGTDILLRPIRAARVDPGDRSPIVVVALTAPTDHATLGGFVEGSPTPMLTWRVTRSVTSRLRAARWGAPAVPQPFTARIGDDAFGTLAAGPGASVLSFAATLAGPVVSRSADGGRTFSAARRIPNGGYTGDERALATDGRGGALLAWDTGSAFPVPIDGPAPEDDGLLLVTTVDAGTGRPRPARVVPSTPPVRDIRAVADPRGGGFVCWTEDAKRLRMAQIRVAGKAHAVPLGRGSGRTRLSGCVPDGRGGATALWTEASGVLRAQDVTRAGTPGRVRTLARHVRPGLILTAAAGKTTAVLYDQAGRRTLRVRR